MPRRQAIELLKLCDKLDFDQLLDLGAYLVACAFHKRKPTQGTK